MTDFTTQITAKSEPIDVARAVAEHLDNLGYDSTDDMLNAVANAIAADRAARARGFTPGEGMPDESDSVWVELENGGRTLAYFNYEGRWISAMSTKPLLYAVVRWWHLPGENR